MFSPKFFSGRYFSRQYYAARPLTLNYAISSLWSDAGLASRQEAGQFHVYESVDVAGNLFFDDLMNVGEADLSTFHIISSLSSSSQSSYTVASRLTKDVDLQYGVTATVGDSSDSIWAVTVNSINRAFSQWSLEYSSIKRSLSHYNTLEYSTTYSYSVWETNRLPLDLNFTLDTEYRETYNLAVLRNSPVIETFLNTQGFNLDAGPVRVASRFGGSGFTLTVGGSEIL